MNKPWTDGPKELLQHAVDHLDMGSDFDRRVAMISIDNGVELSVKTFLGLPERARGKKGPSRRELEEASESFPSLLDLLEKYGADEISGVSLDDIEWYHRLRNQLYHAGNGITVEKSKVEAYLQLAIALYEGLFGFVPSLDKSAATSTRTGEFLALWNDFQRALSEAMPPKQPGDYAFYRKRDFLLQLSSDQAKQYEDLYLFRNALVHGIDTPKPEVIDDYISQVKQLLTQVRKHRDA
ncbi:MAG: hypothetical protein SVM80_09185 [Halobacteriota archaeon]|nr:hypothetical protein [Halobacteriota archaeon]